ncbi:probable LRR receptor-like serine/threonine-protein kinase At1g07650 isoform X1 [Folsomia candida]|uniref:probable LRR receptor-like serine/threonine-protein kinase At1g07650 isoform X1 n=1 Tax=Folsomia candida TaxID=158441 RepID=UPI001604C5FC|nr:probable LRR receptor-like serine/threonine-protein kinase At1g07650 isoform X1 [Folsomia candida]
MFSNIRVVEWLLYIHMILVPAICFMCSVENEAFQSTEQGTSVGLKFALIVISCIMGFGNIISLLIWRRSERFAFSYQVFVFTIPPIFWALLQYKIWWEERIPIKLGLNPGLTFGFCVSFFNSGVLIVIYQDLMRITIGYPPASRSIGVHVTKLITLHFMANFGYALVSLAHIFISQFTQVGGSFYDFLPLTLPIFASEIFRMFLAFVFPRAYKLKSPKLMTRFVCITYANDLVGKAFQFITDYKRLIVLAKPASLWDKSGVSFPIQLFMFMYCYRLWFIYINYFKRRNESKEIVLFHQNFEKFVGEEKIGVVKVKCDQSDQNCLGEGFFGKVYKAEMVHPKEEIVAVKFITDFKSVLKDATALQQELKVLTLLTSTSDESTNLVRFKGIAWHFSDFTYQVAIVLQYCEGGTVKNYLDGIRLDYSFPRNVTSEILESLETWGLQVVNAMKFLESKNVIHGDLSARNVLLDEQRNAKVSDFGMSLKLYQYEEYAHPGQSVFPWRHMSIEAIRDLKFSVKSDVWSFGVLLWEFYTFGETPWAGIEWNGGFVKLLMDGYALRQPDFEGHIYTEVMLPCWNMNPCERPSFEMLEALLVGCSKKMIC